MVVDTHIHTYASDGKMTPEEAIFIARKKGIGLIFTEHYDADYDDNLTDFKVDVKKYMSEYNKYRNADCMLGIEIGLTHMALDINRKIAESADFDYVLGSVHMIGEVDIYLDLAFNSENTTITKQSCLDYTLRMVKENDFYDALGHIDYPCRFFPKVPDKKDAEMDYLEYKDSYDKIFKVLIEKGKPLELNTRRLNSEVAFKSLYRVFKGYKEQGGRYVVLGSDAHNSEIIGKDFNLATGIIQELELTPVYFSKRKMIIC